MKCPYCKAEDTAVIDSRESEDGDSVRRRRQCEACEKRFTTYERVDDFREAILEVKKPGTKRARRIEK